MTEYLSKILLAIFVAMGVYGAITGPAPEFPQSEATQ